MLFQTPLEFEEIEQASRHFAPASLPILPCAARGLDLCAGLFLGQAGGEPD